MGYVQQHKVSNASPWVICLRVREKIILQAIALKFRSDLVELIKLNRKRNLSYTEDSVSEDRTKMA